MNLSRLLPALGRFALPAVTLLALCSPAFAAGGAGEPPGFVWALPFVVLLLCVALLPLIPATEHWWHKNSSKTLVSVVLALVTLGYYFFLRPFHTEEPGLTSIGLVLQHAVVAEYIPFIVLLFSLYTIAGGIELAGDLEAKPLTNTIFLAVGAAIASFVGTTGAAMLLIRPLLRTNSERRHVVHTVVMFIFVVCNCGGLLLPIGDPPLFLGYLRGVPFMWTMKLFAEFALVNGALLVIYFVWDTLAYRKETLPDKARDTAEIEPLALRGTPNLLLLLGVVLCVAFLDPSKKVPGTDFQPPMFMREGLMLLMSALSYYVPLVTPRGLRQRAKFDFFAIGEVGALFIGIFITMQVPLEMLHDPETVKALGVDSPMKFFWFPGGLSSCLDNAPTYVVFFETARGLPEALVQSLGETLDLPTGNPISEMLLKAISCGAVFMGALTYIGNGPNFLVKAIAEQAGVRMPSFFGYMKYSVAVLVPLFVVVGFIWFR